MSTSHRSRLRRLARHHKPGQSLPIIGLMITVLLRQGRATDRAHAIHNLRQGGSRCTSSNPDTENSPTTPPFRRSKFKIVRS